MAGGLIALCFKFNRMKNIILTGSSSGFGLTTAKILAEAGHRVFATMRNTNGRNAEVAASLLQWAGNNAHQLEVVELDVTSDDSVKQAIETISIKTGGIIDVLINNAGSAYIGLNETLSAAQTNQMFQINVIGVDRMIKAVLPFMHRQKDGLLLTLSSVTARQPTPVMGIYASSKAAVDALSVSYYYELKSSGIDVSILQPGAYQTTDIVSNQMVPQNPEAEKDYAADMINYKNAVLKYFEPTDSSPDPREIADKILELIDTPKGQRPLWTLIGAGQLTGTISNINNSVKDLVDKLVSRRAD